MLLFTSAMAVFPVTLLQASIKPPALQLPSTPLSDPRRLPAGLENELYDDVSEEVAHLFLNMQQTTTYEGAYSYLKYAVKQGYITQASVLLRALYLLECRRDTFLTDAELIDWAKKCVVIPAPTLFAARNAAQKKYGIQPSIINSPTTPATGALRRLPAGLENEFILPTFQPNVIRLLTQMQQPHIYGSPTHLLETALIQGIPLDEHALLRALYCIEKHSKFPLSAYDFDLWARQFSVDSATFQHTVYAARHKYFPAAFPALPAPTDFPSHAVLPRYASPNFLPPTLERDLDNPAYGKEVVTLLHNMLTYTVHNERALKRAISKGMVTRADVFLRLLYLTERRRETPFSDFEIDLLAKQCRIDTVAVFHERQIAIDLYKKELQQSHNTPPPSYTPAVYENASAPSYVPEVVVMPSLDQPVEDATPDPIQNTTPAIPTQNTALVQEETAFDSFMKAFGMISASVLTLAIAAMSPTLFLIGAPLAGLLYFQSNINTVTPAPLPDATIDVKVVDVTDQQKAPAKKTVPTKPSVAPLPDVPSQLIPPYFYQYSATGMLRIAATYNILSEDVLQKALPYANTYGIPYIKPANTSAMSLGTSALSEAERTKDDVFPPDVLPYFAPPTLRHPTLGRTLGNHERYVYSINGFVKKDMLTLLLAEKSLPAFVHNPLFYGICKQFMQREAPQLLHGYKHEWVQQTLWGTDEVYSTEQVDVPLQVALSDQQIIYLLQETLRTTKNMLKFYKQAHYSKPRLFTLHVYLSGFVCFFADLFTPDILLGESFLKPFVTQLFKNADFMPQDTDAYTDLFITTYNSFVTSLEHFVDTLDSPELVLYGYSKILLDLIGLPHVGINHALSVMNFILDIFTSCEACLRMKDLNQTENEHLFST